MEQDLIIEMLYLFLVSLIFAGLEVQVEGKNGWASQLPTWRPKDRGYFSKIYRLLLFGKDVTLYHLLIFTLLLAVLHYPYFAGKGWDINQELATLSLFFLLSVVWDFLWFVINPHYGLFRFKKGNIWWHKKWFLFMPLDYWLGLAVSCLFYTRFFLSPILLKEWLTIFFLFSILTLAVIVFAALFKKLNPAPFGSKSS